MGSSLAFVGATAAPAPNAAKANKVNALRMARCMVALLDKVCRQS